MGRNREIIENINTILKNLKNTKSLVWVIKSKFNRNIYNEIKENTLFLKNDSKFTENIYCYINNISSNPKCQYCKNKKVKFICFNKGYNKYCSSKCSSNDPIIKNNKIKTNIQRYWVSHPMKKEEIKENLYKNNLKKYWKKNVFQLQFVKNKIKETNKKKYNCENVMHNKEIKEKLFNTNLKKYWNKCSLQCPIIQNEIQLNNLKKYWVKYILEAEEIINKRKETNKNKWINWWYYNTKLALKKYSTFNNLYNIYIYFKNWEYNIYCNRCKKISIKKHNFIYNRLYIYKLTPCIHCVPIQSNISWIENKFKDFLTKIYKVNWEIEQSNRKILEGQEIDLFLSEANLWIEINWLYWHNDSKLKDKNYHLNKTNKAKEKGIQLVHIFDDEIKQWMMLIYSILQNKGLLKKDLYDDKKIEDLNEEYHIELTKPRKIYARKLKLISIIESKKWEKKKYKEILKKYHIQWDDNAKYYYILEEEKENWENIPLSIMTFKKMSVDKNQIKENWDIKTFELSRYVTIPWIQIVGWFKKLLSIFKKDILKEYGDISIKLITYSNLRYSNEDNNVYLRNWFNKIGFTWINYYYFYEWRKYHRFKFRKDQLYYKYLPEYWIPVDLDYKKESEAWMIEKMREYWIPINKIFDCGHLKWEKEI